jgi:hypothetical protein
MEKVLQILILALVFAASTIFGQAKGDYGTNSTTATWTTPSHWVICVSPGNGTLTMKTPYF